MLTLELTIGKQKTTVIAAYGPNENEKKEVKDKFWEDLTIVTEASTGEILVAGDLNARVGIRKNETEKVIGRHGEITRNYNGKRMIEYCTSNNLIITNTFYEHKDIHKYTRVVANRNEKSIID